MSKMNSLSHYQTKPNLNLPDSQRISLFSQSNATPLARSTQISSIIECLICQESIRQAHMCPSCCKMFCESCIKNWIRNKKGECPNPNCQKDLNNNNLLNCSILGRQIEQALSKSVSKIKNPMASSVILSPSGSKLMFPLKAPVPIYESPSPVKNSDVLCDKHQLKLDYYCEQCLVALCSDCAVLSKNHQGHKLCKFSQKKSKFKEQVSKLQKQVTAFKQKLKNIKGQAARAIEQLKLVQNEKQTSLNTYLHHIFEKNMENYEKNVYSRQQNFNFMRQSYENLSRKLEQVEGQVEDKGKSKFIKNCHILQNQATQLMKNIQLISFMPFSRIENELVPEFEQKIYILDNYDQLRQKGQVLISQPMFIKGTQWKLKIFPGGVDPSQNFDLNGYLAIHLQMSKSHSHVNWYRYRIELVNQANRGKCMSFQFENDFKEGSEWCLDNFIKISSLYSQNYIHPEQGYIEIVLYIRCLSYYHAVKDQKQFIVGKQLKANQNYCHLLNLRKTASDLGLKVENKAVLGWSKKDNQMTPKKGQTKKLIAIDEND